MWFDRFNSITAVSDTFPQEISLSEELGFLGGNQKEEVLEHLFQAVLQNSVAEMVITFGIQSYTGDTLIYIVATSV